MLILTCIAVFLALISKVLLNQTSIKHEFVFYTFEHGGYKHKKGQISMDPGEYEHHLSDQVIIRAAWLTMYYTCERWLSVILEEGLALRC